MTAARIRLRVAPGSSGSVVVGPYLEGWKVRVHAPADGGRANDAVIRLLADVFSVPRSRVTIVTGHTSRTKAVEVEGLSDAAAHEALARASTGAG